MEKLIVLVLVIFLFIEIGSIKYANILGSLAKKERIIENKLKHSIKNWLDSDTLTNNLKVIESSLHM